MRTLTRAAYAIGIVAAVALSAATANAQPRYGNTYDSYNRGGSVPYDAGGPAYGYGQRENNSSSDFQLQGR